MIEEAQQHLEHLKGMPYYDELVTEVAIGLQKRGNVRDLHNNPANRVQRIIEGRISTGPGES